MNPSGGRRKSLANYAGQEVSKRGLDNINKMTDGMLLPPLCAQADYVNYAKEAGLSVSGGPKDISEDVKATW